MGGVRTVRHTLHASLYEGLHVVAWISRLDKGHDVGGRHVSQITDVLPQTTEGLLKVGDEDFMAHGLRLCSKRAYQRCYNIGDLTVILLGIPKIPFGDLQLLPDSAQAALQLLLGLLESLNLSLKIASILLGVGQHGLSVLAFLPFAVSLVHPLFRGGFQRVCLIPCMISSIMPISNLTLELLDGSLASAK